MDMERRLRLELTPDKSRVVEKRGYIQIKYINKIGTVKRREECDSCSKRGRVQLGLGYGMGYSCDASADGWKDFKGITKRKCKLYERREDK